MKSFDLNLPQWGPYSKRWFGLSHVADKKAGSRFDFAAVTGFYRRKPVIPDGRHPDNYLPLQVASDLKSYSYRQQIEWKNKVFMDVNFNWLDENSRLIRCNLVNNEEFNHDLVIHFVAGLELNPVTPCVVKKGEWLDAVKYKEFNPKNPRSGFAYDGMRPNELFMGECVNNSALMVNDGDTFCFQLPFNPATLKIRLKGKSTIKFKLNGHVLLFPASEKFVEYSVSESDFVPELFLEAQSDFILDGFGSADLSTEMLRQSNRPEFKFGPTSDSIIIHYPGLSHCYGIKWDFKTSFIKHYSTPDFMNMLHYNDCVRQEFIDGYEKFNEKDNYINIVFQPIKTNAHSQKDIFGLVACGSETEVFQKLADSTDLKTLYFNHPPRMVEFTDSPYKFSQERMSSVVLTNVVFPARIKNEFVKHHTPGRYWDCLYTWDSGMIGLGLLEIDVQRAVENLNAYLIDANDSDAPFVMHGTLVPTQIYLFQEIFKRTNDLSFLKKFYPSIRRYYDFYAGHATASPVRKCTQEPAICIWPLNYNSGGWDDYPPQWENKNHPELRAVPAVNTAHTIRCAKILRQLAGLIQEECGVYDADILELTESLHKYYWDDECGYFSYLCHDESGRPLDFLRDGNGANFNMGLDGASPLFAAAVTPGQAGKLWANLSDENHLWSDVGLSTVDRSAPYFKNNGYWNGSVWIPYQWFFWKAALDSGRGGFAWQIAETILNVWEKECQQSYGCFEHFSISSGCGAGWMHFSGLSSPVLSFFNAYFKPGELTSGFDTLVTRRNISGQNFSFDLQIAPGVDGFTSLLFVGNPVACNYCGVSVEIIRRNSHCCEIKLPKNTSGTLNFICSATASHSRQAFVYNSVQYK